MTTMWKSNLDKGDEVFWEDPDDGKCSGLYTVLRNHKSSKILELENDSGSYVQVFWSEVR